MAFTDDKYSNIASQNATPPPKGSVEAKLSSSFDTAKNKISANQQEEVKTVLPRVEKGTLFKGDPFYAQDSHIVVKYFESEVSQWGEEDYAWATHYRDVYSTENFSQRVREQMAYYPGLQSAKPGYGSGAPQEDPFKTHAKQAGDRTLNSWNNAMDSPDAFMNGVKQRQPNIDYKDVVDNPTVKNVAMAIAECIPCFDRLFDGAQLWPDGDILEIHALNIKLRTDLIDKLMKLFQDPGFNIDICELLKMLSRLCPQDLLAILALLTQYLAKLNLDFKFNLDLVVELLGAILSPFLDALGQWLDKWIQMIIAPIICVIDHINTTIYIAQQMKIPLSESSVDVGWSGGVAAPSFLGDTGGFSNALSRGGLHTGMQTPEGETLPEGFFRGSADEQLFNTPDSEKYNPPPPYPPQEEWDFAAQQIRDDAAVARGDIPSLTETQRKAIWDDMKKQRWEHDNYIPPPMRQPKADGSRWSPDTTPNSERVARGDSYTVGSYPPEKQTIPKRADEYYMDASVIIDPIIQARNIIMGAIAAVQDWFRWITQMIMDLLGTDFGWMKKKLDQTQLKSRLIQLIMMIKAILEAIAKNGLKCGNNTNFDSAQYRWIMEGYLNNVSAGYKFKARDDGSYEIVTPDGVSAKEDIASKASGVPVSSKSTKDVKTANITVKAVESKAGQEVVGSGIIIKDCLQKVDADQLNRVRSWINDLERRNSAG